MKEFSELLAWAAVVVSCATFIASIAIAVVAAIFGKRAILAIGSHKIAELREGWKEKLRANIADLLRLRDQLHTEEADVGREEIRHKIVRRAARTILMLTPGKHDDIRRQIARLLAEEKIEIDTQLIDASQPFLKETWEQIEADFLGKKKGTN